MSILINHILNVEEPKWEVLTYKLRWWQIKKVDMRIVFSYQIKEDNQHYRIDYNVENEDIIFCHKKPSKLLTKLGVDINNRELWLQEQRELLKIFLNQYDCSVKNLIRCKPKKPKWFNLIF